jgi:uncharacterized protein (TIGR02599 family)
MTVLSVLLLVSAQVIGQVQETWTASNARVSQFREARTAFDILTRNLSQATLNTYIDYDLNYLAETTTAADAPVASPTSYVRKSDLQFICGEANVLVEGAGDGGAEYLPGSAVFFQAPLGVAQQPGLTGLDKLLCGRGYFVQFSSDEFFQPSGDFLPPGNLRYRYRLMEFCPPAEKNLIYDTTGDDNNWYEAAGAPMLDQEEENPLNQSLNRPVADNIISLIISPRNESSVESINKNLEFNSREVGTTAGIQGTQHLLPPMLKIVLVAIDERSAERLAGVDGNSAPPLSDELGPYHQKADTGSDADLEAALRDLKTALVAKRVNYRVFSTTVQIRGAKWSK